MAANESQQLPLVVGFAEVCNALGLSRSTIERRIRDGSFPKPALLSKNRVGWLAATIKEWQGQRLDTFAVSDPTKLQPEAAFDAAVANLADTYSRLSGDSASHVAFMRHATPAELQQQAAAESAGIAQMLKALDSMSPTDAKRAAGLLFPRLTNEASLDRAERVEGLCELIGRAVARLRPLPRA